MGSPHMTTLPTEETTGDTAIPGRKETLRREVRDRISGLRPADRLRREAAIHRHIEATEAYRGALQLFAYSALQDEVNLWPLLESAHGEGKAVFLPVTDTETWTIGFRRWVPGAAMESGRSTSVDEPVSAETPSEMPSLTLVPGRAFDASGHRLGRGRGCYDRVLPDLARVGLTVGVGYEVQKVDCVPVEPHDRTLDAVVTECGLIPF